jgi:hypothetical protein
MTPSSPSRRHVDGGEVDVLGGRQMLLRQLAGQPLVYVMLLVRQQGGETWYSLVYPSTKMTYSLERK